MDQLLEKQAKDILAEIHKPWLPYVLSLLLFLASIFYTKLKTTVVEMGGHKFYLAAVAQSETDGVKYYTMVYREPIR